MNEIYMKPAMFKPQFPSAALFFASVVALGGWSSPADVLAFPITYTEQATTSGSLGGTAYSNALTTIVFTGDTGTVTNADPGEGVFKNTIGTVTLTVTGFAPGAFTTGGDVFVNQTTRIVGIEGLSCFGCPAILLGTSNSSLASYDLTTSIGP